MSTADVADITKPIGTGDEVIYGPKSSNLVSRVLAIDDDFAWCKSTRTGERFTAPIKDLRPHMTEGS